jgi:hypothetical protein
MASLEVIPEKQVVFCVNKAYLQKLISVKFSPGQPLNGTIVIKNTDPLKYKGTTLTGLDGSIGSRKMLHARF